MNTLLEQDTDIVAFGRHMVLPGRGELQSEDKNGESRTIVLGPRATAVLMALIASRGNVVSQDALLAQAWPGQDIHASNLRVQIAALRKALGEDRNLIGTVAGRGYVFAGRLSTTAATALTAPAAARPCTRQLPLPMAELIGREAQLRDALARLDGCRLLTLAGTGGIGKTQLALAIAHRVALAPAGSVAWAELAEIRDAAGVAAAVACALGLESGDSGGSGALWEPAGTGASGEPKGWECSGGSGDPGDPGDSGASAGRGDPGAAGGHTPATLAAHIGQQQLLLVLDNCEHLADAVARLVEALLQRCPHLRLLLTSRQPLLAAGETVWRVPPLAVPDVDMVEGAHLLQYSALQLFVARVRAADSAFVPTPRMAVQIAAICRRLEGLPLAVELAAACVPALGVEQTAAGLEDMLRLLRRGRRNAPLRHQSMRAALDWSYALLAEPMRCALQHLAALPDGFTIEAAVAALGGEGFSLYEAIDALAGLVSHSLALVDHGGPRARYRLPATTRAYALELRGAGAG
ncbi:winged helix-turn-helix domain-containing protein [Massilia sp. Root418]|uniref:ATP-binding protein n=1 Tax=Massilia sp. Root418 TaxID=1736532 RepID=UPI0009EBCDE2|nr:winged helix-turn-helix domain-containing protein [Massilia sp. Root418]